jgi:hypothetical protein
MSEPEFLISVMDRHCDWCTIICLVGGGQEINAGEAGLTEWFSALKRCFPDWKVYTSEQLTHRDYHWGQDLGAMLVGLDSKSTWPAPIWWSGVDVSSLLAVALRPVWPAKLGRVAKPAMALPPELAACSRAMSAGARCCSVVASLR